MGKQGRWRTLCALLLALGMAAGGATAQVPNQLNYQGMLTSAGGQPHNGPVTAVFRIYSVPSGGAALYTETQSLTATNGLLNAAIGSVTPLALPFDVPYWLGVAINGDPEMTPRQAVLSSAYARRAANAGDAQTLGGRPPADFVLIGSAIPGNLVTGSITNATVPTTQLSGTVGTAQIANSAVTQSKLSASGAVAGQVLGTDGANLQWQAPSAGTVSSISQGAGITLSPNPITSTGTVAADTSYVQRRVAQSCAGGAISGINADGTVTCTTIKRTAAAFVQPDGTFSGGGLTVTRTGVGAYTITYVPSFTGNPAIFATPGASGVGFHFSIVVNNSVSTSVVFARDDNGAAADPPTGFFYMAIER